MTDGYTVSLQAKAFIALLAQRLTRRQVESAVEQYEAVCLFNKWGVDVPRHADLPPEFRIVTPVPLKLKKRKARR